jgi:hypothetical protein
MRLCDRILTGSEIAALLQPRRQRHGAARQATRGR